MSITSTGEPPTHNASAYSNWGCRCEVCRESEAARRRALVARRRTRANIPPELHGLYTTYNNWLCRCTPCRAAWAAYRRDLRNR